MRKKYTYIIILFIVLILSISFSGQASNIKHNFRLSYNINRRLPEKKYDLSHDERLYIPEFHVRGIYVNGWVAGVTEKMDNLIDLVGKTVINTMVIDIKDQSGYLSYKSKLPFAKKIGANRRKIRDIKGLLDKLHSKEIYVIGRIVLFKDALLAQEQNELSLRLFNSEELKIKVSKSWVDPSQKLVWDYNIGLAREAIELGFDEIQFDYIRYPALAGSSYQVTTLSNYPKSYYINRFAHYATEKLADKNIPISIDVFGLTTTVRDDLGIGQNFFQLSKIIKIISPMVYPSHYSPGSYGLKVPALQPYQVIYNSLYDAREKITGDDDIIIRPWLQDFSLKHKYTYKEIKEQINAAEKLGIKEWLLWNPGSRYTEKAILNPPL